MLNKYNTMDHTEIAENQIKRPKITFLIGNNYNYQKL